MSGTQWLRIVAVAVITIVWSAPAQASAELGVDAGVDLLRFENENSTVISLPMGGDFFTFLPGFRVGFDAGEHLSIEPAVGFVRASEGGDSISLIKLGASLLANLTTDRSKAQPYLRGGGSVLMVSGFDEDESQTFLGGAVGVRVPVKDPFMVRLEAGAFHGFEGDLESVNIITFRGGFSFFTN